MIESERYTNGWTLKVTGISDASDAEAVLDAMEQVALNGGSADETEIAGMTTVPDYLTCYATIAHKGD